MTDLRQAAENALIFLDHLFPTGADEADLDTYAARGYQRQLRDALAQSPGGWRPVENTISVPGYYIAAGGKYIEIPDMGATLPEHLAVCEWAGAQPPAAAGEANHVR